MNDDKFSAFDVKAALSRKPDDLSYISTVSIPKSATKAKPKTVAPEVLSEAEELGKKRGFVDRSPGIESVKRPPGRPRSIYTAQLHTRVKPETLNLIIKDSEEQGCIYGKIVEEAFDLYRKARKKL